MNAKLNRLGVVLILTGAISLLPALAGLAAVDSQETFTVSGAVVNGTVGGSTPSGLAVFLLVTAESGELVYSGQAETGPEGGFSFPGVPMVSGNAEVGQQFLFSVTYDEVPYNAALSLSEAAEDIVLEVYETTSDVSVIQIQRQVLVIAGIDEKARLVSALEFVRFSNDSDRTLKPDLESTAPMMSFLRFSLPAGTAGLSVNSDLPSGEIISVGTGFAVTSPVAPGAHSVEYSFTFPYLEDSVSYRQNLIQGAEVYQVMAPEGLAGLDIAPLEPGPPIDIQGTGYRVWELRDRAPREGIMLEISNLPQPSLPSRLASSLSGSSFWKTAVPILMGIGLAAALAGGLATRQRLTAGRAAETPRVPENNTETEAEP